MIAADHFAQASDLFVVLIGWALAQTGCDMRCVSGTG